MERIIKKECTVGYKWWSENKPEEVYYECGETENGYCFKDEDAFKEKKGICYIPEYDFNEWHQRQEESEEYIEPDGYEYESFLLTADGVPPLAENLFWNVDWQHPDTLLNEWGEGSGIEEIFHDVTDDQDSAFLHSLAEIYDEEKYGTDWHNYYDFYMQHKKH